MGSDGSMKDTHTILNEIIVAAKECGQVMLQADRNNFGIKDKAGKSKFCYSIWLQNPGNAANQIGADSSGSRISGRGRGL